MKKKNKMREQIEIELPFRIGRIIEKSKVKRIIVHKNHRDITINLVDDEEFNIKEGKIELEIETKTRK